MRVTALIVCAGRGTRMGPGAPKQYRVLGPLPVLRHTAIAFLNHSRISDIAVVIHKEDRALYEEAVRGLRLLPPVIGGATRDESVRLGLEALADTAPDRAPPDRVLIHDGVRPFVTEETIGAVISALDEAEAAIAAMPVFDTIKSAADGTVTGTIDRSILWRAQTPQAFRFPTILAAHRAVAGRGDLPPVTDDASVAEALGIPVRIVQGSEDAFKITTEADLRRAERHLRGDE
ncbi:2-C-methyl-D-erythritol 4-phosphate cytidylyltransferase [Acidisoma cellulosilytica]|uniref:2-C-methyl-D-erythritol 4-phosphate cytidylyltransferase n=1 Tax=Acidisoma cellulosilyticum TaxID=2802395 RepID=A0A963YYX8_9PROT|nr:2-C-methyl-D-erythritol 4-phosphate cytidylyltransferase [Acidisoma cellulosilyticum]MCB8879757.1 2-C-methyl-D-erythritol 4-phosphate cytidylyltransferase [Acidisoma cellulosilyticum]